MTKITKLANGCKQTTCSKCGTKIIISAPIELRDKLNGGKWGDDKYYCKTCSRQKNTESLKKRVDSGIKATLEKVKKVYPCPICQKYTGAEILPLFDTKADLAKHLKSAHGNEHDVAYMLRYGGRTRGLR